jgi:hypothetical protein
MLTIDTAKDELREKVTDLIGQARDDLSLDPPT